MVGAVPPPEGGPGTRTAYVAPDQTSTTSNPLGIVMYELGGHLCLSQSLERDIFLIYTGYRL